MHKIAIAIAVLLAAGERADACPDAAWIPDEVGYAFGLAVAGGYAGGIAYFGDHDLANDRNDQDYVTGDIAFNGLFTALWGTATVDAIEDHSGYAVPLAGLTLLHGAMLAHGLDHAHFDFRSLNGTAAEWTIGALYAGQALVFIGQADDHNDRGYGITEAAINAPLAAGAAYLAYRAGGPGNGARAMLFTGIAGVSGALAVHGIATAISPYHAAALDLLGTDVAPTIVDDGREMGPGLGAGGTF
jgi:hypothetical protein